MPYAQRLAGRLTPALLICGGLAFGQYPGQYPGGYPGGYPPGVGIPGIHFPQRHPKDANSSAEDPSDAQLISVSGKLRQIKDKKLLLETEENTVLRFRLLDKTRFQNESDDALRQSHLHPGDRLTIEVNPDDQETAVKVIQVREGGKSERKSAEQPVDEASVRAPKKTDFNQAEAGAQEATPAKTQTANVATPPPDLENDPDRPRLSRTSGAGSASPPATTGPEAAPSEGAAAPPKPVDVSATVPPPSDPHAPNFNSDERILADARIVAASFSTTLPAYLAQQVTSRFFRTTGGDGWQPIDEVSAELAFAAGKEKYGNFQRDGQQIDRPTDESGIWSTREFRRELEDFQAIGASGKFTRRGEEKIGSRTTVAYDLTVPQSASNWVLSSPDGRRQTAAYACTVWIDKENHRVLRIERHTASLPHDFFFSSAQETVNYGFASLDQHTYLLPAGAENATCISGSGTCTRNVIEFHDYRPLTVDAQARF
jgi:hypothetical protein